MVRVKSRSLRVHIVVYAWYVSDGGKHRRKSRRVFCIGGVSVAVSDFRMCLYSSLFGGRSGRCTTDGASRSPVCRAVETRVVRMYLFVLRLVTQGIGVDLIVEIYTTLV